MKFLAAKFCLPFLFASILLTLHSCGLVEEPISSVTCSGTCSGQVQETGVFVDSEVAGVTYTTSSGISGTTTSSGQFS